MLKIGEKVPEFEASAYHDGEIKQIKLSDYEGQWVVLVFYPADFTFICPTELQDVAGRYNELQELGAEVLSVSTDTVFTHKAWKESSPAVRDVAFPMVGDPKGRLCRQFGTFIEEGDDEGLSLRGTFIIDPDGVLTAFELHDNSVGRSGDELVRKVQAAKHVREADGEVCPAGWTPGAKTLKPGLDLVGQI